MERGAKVLVASRSDVGFGELIALEGSARARVRYFASPARSWEAVANVGELRHLMIPDQSRCFVTSQGTTQYGRVFAPLDGPDFLRTYFVKLAGVGAPVRMREDEFQVRSSSEPEDPVEVLGAFANETPFFFENRRALLHELMRQGLLCQGLPALLSSKIEILQHQTEVASRVLRDPTMRYLLADEVGLGKTIEAGIVLRQVALDTPRARMAAVVPDPLVRQWQEELVRRFDLRGVKVFSHSQLAQVSGAVEWDMVVIDEAHRVVADSFEEDTPLATGARKLASSARHLLLLSATPALHHDADLLALLELLDPANYSRDDLAAFRKRAAKRTELGRALLALRDATVPALAKRHAATLARLLPEDSVLAELADRIASTGADIGAVQRVLQLHVSETYRIHRRMLRTRRRWLAVGAQRFVRSVRESVEYALEEEPYLRLWGLLDEWRTDVAARVSEDAVLRATCASAYVRLSEAIAAAPDDVERICQEVGTQTQATASERQLLADVANEVQADDLINARLDLVASILERRMSSDPEHAKYVVFCPSAGSCVRVGARLERATLSRRICVADSSRDRSEVGELLGRFPTDPEVRILVTDAVGEEGFNLQCARFVLLYDLPWAPMRLEQRLGRLDRISGAGRITCTTLVSCEDDSIALDETWRRVVVEGFGLLNDSVSDVQYLIDMEVPRLRDLAFIGGPAALIGELERLASDVRSERAAIEEQDVIDGMYFESSQSALCRDLASADLAANDLGKALALYLNGNLGFKEKWNEDEGSFAFYLPRDKDPLLPADQISLVEQLLNASFTVSRDVVLENLSLRLLRPGQAGMDGCRKLLRWDDRGRAFAMWRALPGAKTLRTIFRCNVHVSVELEPVRALLERDGWDPLRSGGLLRLVRAWFPEFIHECFVDDKGDSPPASIVALCRRRYDRHVDVNLGKGRAAFVREALGARTWHEMCALAASGVLEAVSQSPELERARARAQAEARDYFAVLRTRLGARRQSGLESAELSEAEGENERRVETLVADMLARPVIRMDAIGAYLLSESPFWSGSQ